MRIDISSDSFNLVQGYTRVLLQQGRPILDRDWNEQTAIVLDRLRAVTRSIYGRHGGPAGGECGFIPIDGEKQLGLRSGWYTIDGLMLICPSGPGYMATLEAKKTYLVYLEAIEREVTAAEQESLLDSALPGIDVAARGQVMGRVHHFDWSEWVNDNTGCSGVNEMVNSWLKEKCKIQESPGITFPEDKNLAGKAKHKHELKELARKNPNQLLRVECHSVEWNSAEGWSKSTWKVSTDNAFVLFRIANLPGQTQTSSNEITIRLGALESWIPVKSDFVELLSHENVKFNEPGLLLAVKDVVETSHGNVDTVDGRTIEFEKPVNDIAKFAFVRVWNDMFEITNPQGAEPGDYWQFSGREGASTIDTANLKRPSRVFAPLALVSTNENRIPKVIQRFQRIMGVPWREIDEDIDLPN
ncbi:DUF6519 domain-containing protein [Bradyrhizobium sp. JYMT SZCCT0180]|uniref:DUF6519 domain-containing protein n=1 Tax=Bradyrhizobium sp. JYMT SZCCT0180 TaxID=2807666 RepID=UPI001BA7E94B|nr:DUF6519 domain-containing protein [Bradyrhizobium sp. JYMT SZCCT0180]MBR1214656.1 hypothetical protein [Bradyrhizobium sp. JYMT SZCCT0180]